MPFPIRMFHKILQSRGLAAPAKALCVAGAVFFALQVHGSTNLFSTAFEASAGYDSRYELIGQNGWVTDNNQIFGGNGLFTNFIGTQAGYIGLFPLTPQADYLALWQPINYLPVQNGTPIVQFSVLMSIVDSTTTNRDDFYWSVYNTQGDCLFTIDFWNEDLGVYYALDGTNQLTYTGVQFTNEVNYSLTVTMDFSQNRWSATLNGAALVNNKLITTTGARLDLGDVDALWVLGNSSRPGDNYMIFDNYQVRADVAPTAPPRIVSLGHNANRQYGVRVEGSLNARYAVEASSNLSQWTALTTNTAANGSFEYRDPASPTISNRVYRARLVR